MKPCPYIEIRLGAMPQRWRTATLCALPEGHGGLLHVMQSGRELRKWEAWGTYWCRITVEGEEWMPASWRAVA